jgi:16S rRNA (guanine966-N2)-methyltransferase
VPDLPGLRPTPDRVRETLFNWLAPLLPGARCLDLFAGSGALGFEAASRGAAQVVMVESASRAVGLLRGEVLRLRAAVEVVHADVLAWLARPARPFDIVFLDPPYRQGLMAPACRALAQAGWLAPDARIYLEAEPELEPLPLPATWSLLRSKRAGQVGYHLAVAARPTDRRDEGQP